MLVIWIIFESKSKCTVLHGGWKTTGYAVKNYKLWSSLTHGCWQERKEKERERERLLDWKHKMLLLIAKAVVGTSGVLVSIPQVPQIPRGQCQEDVMDACITEEERRAWENHHLWDKGKPTLLPEGDITTSLRTAAPCEHNPEWWPRLSVMPYMLGIPGWNVQGHSFRPVRLPLSTCMGCKAIENLNSLGMSESLITKESKWQGERYFNHISPI